MANLPYVTSSSSLKTAFDKIRSAATPPRVTTDFVNTVLQIKGGTGGAITPFLKRVGFAASDGTPTELYRRFRNPLSGGPAMAEAVRFGYTELVKANEYFYRLSDKELFALIVQVTGADAENSAAKMTLACLKVLKSFADFELVEAKPTIDERARADEQIRQPIQVQQQRSQDGRVGLNLSYTINLNLPATADQAVFNAIFRSLKEHLLSSNE
ncbi:DUF5343 domain-containing protein [Pseudorhodoferax sp. Leaf267]|uniref:DUF5343 domain-containing protein n=1 Tax=Pseudorhodoferax sp. Leaf267 TaxID=1736316 RepID=UPI0012E1CF32|nr:DUF5343 domain-containing protein [Pseudorhodoferax sp. Leaf267]